MKLNDVLRRVVAVSAGLTHLLEARTHTVEHVTHVCGRFPRGIDGDTVKQEALDFV